MVEHWCTEHKTAWFKRGNMKGFAHPIKDDKGKDTGTWCNKPAVEEFPPGEDSGKVKEQAGKETILDSPNRGYALSYAKDLVVAGKVEIKALLGCADKMCAWLDGKPQNPLVEEAKKLAAKSEE